MLTSGSLPSQLDEEEERRKRRREKNKVAAARCRNKKKERTEFLQRVSGPRAGAGSGLVHAWAKSSKLWYQCARASAQATSTPLLFPAPRLIHPPEPRQPRAPAAAPPPQPLGAREGERSPVSSTEVRPLVPMDPNGLGLVLPILPK